MFINILNSLSAHNFSKLTQLKPDISMYKYNFICLSETYLDSSTPDGLLEIDRYSLVRVDHPNNIKTGEVYIYHKELLPVPSCKFTLSQKSITLRNDLQQ